MKKKMSAPVFRPGDGRSLEHPFGHLWNNREDEDDQWAQREIRLDTEKLRRSSGRFPTPDPLEEETKVGKRQKVSHQPDQARHIWLNAFLQMRVNKLYLIVLID